MKTTRVLAAILLLLTYASAAPGFERVGDKKILVFAGRQEVPTIDPSIKYDWSIRMMQQALYDGLVKYVGNPPEIQPWLAERWEVSPDAKTWTFHLARQAKFTNGDPVTAEAVRWSFARTLKLNQGPAWMLSDFLKEDGIKVLNEHTIQFTLTQSYAPFLSFVPWWYVMNPRQVLANEQNGDLGQKWLTENAAGSGPFRIKRWQQGVLYELEAVDGYWKGWPSKDHVGGVILKLVRESAAQRAGLQRGEFDIVEGLSSDDYDVVGKLPGIVVPNFPGMTTFGLKMNTQKAPSIDAYLGKAMAYAFDYEALV
jgi:peptide/nickel transport system substrate-binding protein